MAQSEAVFLIDTEYGAFHEAWEDLVRVLGELGDLNGVYAEPFRLTLSPTSQARFPRDPKPDSVGFHFYGAGSRALELFLKQAEVLERAGVSYRISGAPRGRPDETFLRFEPDDGHGPCIVIPFEDRAENTARFLSHFTKAFAAALEISPKRAQPLLEKFAALQVSPGRSEKPFDLAAKASVFSKSKRMLTIQAWFGSVGRHEIINRFEIRLPREGENAHLIKTLSHFLGIGKSEDPELFFQFFLKHDQTDLVLIPESHIYETTLQYDNLDWSNISKLIGNIGTGPQLSLLVRDCFSLVEQKTAMLKEPCSITYTLRGTNRSTYEIRLNPVWKSAAVDSEMAFQNFEARTGLTHYRIS